MSPLQIRYISPDELRPHPRNASNHSERQIDKISASIRSFGFNSPVIVDDDRKILAGHGRVLAAIKLGLKEVPSVALRHLSETQRRAFMLPDLSTHGTAMPTSQISSVSAKKPGISKLFFTYGLIIALLAFRKSSTAHNTA